MNRTTIRRTVRAFYIANFAASSDFLLAIYLLFYHNYIGLSFTQAMIVVSCTWITSIVFDLFGGATADKYGRKRTYLVGKLLFICCSLLPLLFVKDFYVLVALAVAGGYGAALASNTLGPIIAEVLHDDQKTFRRINAHSQVILFLARVFASLVGGYLFTIDVLLPLITYIAACLVAMTAASFMYEPAVEKPDGRTHQIALEAISYLRKNAPIVLRISFTMTFVWFAGDILYSYYQVFFTNHAFSAAALGIIFAVISLFSALGSWLVKFMHHAMWRAGILAIMLIVTIVNGFGFVTNTPWIALITVMMMAVISGFGEPTLRLVANEHSPSRLRSSILSVASSITSLGTVLGFLVAGVIADHGSAAWAGSLAIAISLGGLLLYKPDRTAKKGTAGPPATTDRNIPAAENI